MGSSSNMCDLPEELVTEVLVRVTAEMAPRLRCVSKSWKTLIDNPEFRHMRYKGITHLICLSNKNQLYMTGFVDGLEKMIEIEQKEGFEIDLVGSCNGFLCLLLNDFQADKYKVVVMNPCTKKYVEIPKVPCRKQGDRRHVGFGYDNVNDDYKVVRLYDRYLSVYSFISKTWGNLIGLLPWSIRKGGRNSPWIRSNQRGIFVNGALHWIRVNMNEDNYKFENAIAAFDLATEKFDVFSLPLTENYVLMSSAILHDFGEIYGCLSVLIARDKGCDVWTMKECGVPDSWTKLNLRGPNDRTLLGCRFNEISIMTSNNFDENDNGLVLWEPGKWKKMFTFTPNLVNLPPRNLWTDQEAPDLLSLFL